MGILLPHILRWFAIQYIRVLSHNQKVFSHFSSSYAPMYMCPLQMLPKIRKVVEKGEKENHPVC